MKTQKTAKAKKRYVKEDEAEAVRMKAKEEEEAETEKKPTEEVDGKLIKEDEAEDEDESCNKEDEDESEDRMSKEDEDEDEEEDEEEDLEEKDVFGGKDPTEEAVSSGTEGHTTTTRPVNQTRQHVFVPSSNVKVHRENIRGTAQTGQSPSEVTYGKSVNPDLMKSPLFVELNKSIDGMKDSVQKKLDAIEKSMNDRVTNLQKTLGKLEEFYKSPFYKAIESDNQTFEKKSDTFSEQLSKGNVRFTD